MLYCSKVFGIGYKTDTNTFYDLDSCLNFYFACFHAVEITKGPVSIVNLLSIYTKRQRTFALYVFSDVFAICIV